MSAIYDANEYLIAGLENRAEWWEHLGDAHRDYAALAKEAVALAELQPFPVETVMAWKRRVDSAEAIVRYARILLDPNRQDEPGEENALRAYEALSGIPVSVDPLARNQSDPTVGGKP